MKKYLLVGLFLSIFCGCKKSSSSTTDLKGKAFYGVASASCNPTRIVNLSSVDYVLMVFEDASGNDVSFQPKPNTWYKMSNSGVWAKTGSDVTPKDIPLGFGFRTTEYSSPCQ